MRDSLCATVILCAAFLTPEVVLNGCQQQDPEVKGREKTTALMEAATKGGLSTVRRLLQAGAPINEADVDGYTALHYAAHCGDIHVVNALLRAGANVNARTKENVTPLMISIDMMCPIPEVTLALIEAGADVNVVDSQGNTALWIATTESSSEVMEALLKKGANPNVQVNEGGATPLHMASMNGLSDTVKLLIRYGTKVTIKNLEGKTPLDVVNPRYAQIRKLLESQANAKN